MQRGTLLALAVCAAGMAGPAHAQMQGAYFGAGGLAAQTDNARDFALAFGGTGADRRASGAKVYGGYWWPRFGVEAAYYDLGTYEVRTGAVKSDDFRVAALVVSGVLVLPLGAHFYASGRLGLAMTAADYRCFAGCGGNFVDTSDAGIAGHIGAGIDWRMTRNLSLRADAESIGPVSHSVGLIRADYHYRALSISLQADF
jgi:hypothetical protein